MGQFSFTCPNCGCLVCTCPNKPFIGVLYPEFSVDLPTIGTCPPNVLPGTYLPAIQAQGGFCDNNVSNGDCCWFYLINPGAPIGSAAFLNPGSISSPSGCPSNPSGAAGGWVLTFESGAPSPLIKYIYPSPGQLFPGLPGIPSQFLGGGPSWTFSLCNIINSGCPNIGLGSGFPWGLPLTLQVFADSTGTPCTNCADCPFFILPGTLHVTLTSPNGNCTCLAGTYPLTWTQTTNLWQVTVPGVCGAQNMLLQVGCFINSTSLAQYTFAVSCGGVQQVAGRTSVTCSPFSATFDIGTFTLGCPPCGGTTGIGLHAVVTF
jgi:hypothetical protein